MPPSPAVGRRHTELVGRDAQLDVLADRVAALADGRGGLVLLAGEPGIGKTRLAEEAVALARPRAPRPPWATAVEGEGAPPLWPWCRSCGSWGAADAPGRTVDGQRPRPRRRFAQADALAGAPHDGGRQPAAARARRPAVGRPGLDRVLVHAGAPAGRLPARGDLSHRRAARADLGALARVGTTLAVPPLDVTPLELLAAPPAASSPPTVAAVIAAQRRQPPVRVGVRPAHRPVGPPRRRARRGPDRGGRRDRAPARPAAEDAVAILRVGAILGGPFSGEVVAASPRSTRTPSPTRSTPPAAVGILVPCERPGDVDFAHGLVRDVVLQGIDRTTRAALHARAAACSPARRRDPTLHAVVADHLEQAGTGHAGAASSTGRRRPAGRPTSLAHDDAAACFARAAAGCRDDPTRRTSSSSPRPTPCSGGDLVGAREGYARAGDEAPSPAPPELLARAVLGIGTGPVAWEVPIGDEEQAGQVARALDAPPVEAAPCAPCCWPACRWRRPRRDDGPGAGTGRGGARARREVGDPALDGPGARRR